VIGTLELEIGTMVSGDGLETASDLETANLTPTSISLHQLAQTVKFLLQIKATATTLDLDRAGHDLIQVHKLFFFKYY
jgi:hypothetical protein